MPKIKITESQYKSLLLNEKQNRLINENLQLLEEGWKDVVLGISLLLGVGLSGQNKAIAQDALKNEETMSQIKSTLEDENKLGELVDALKEKGMSDPETRLAQNADKVVDMFNKVAKDDNIKYRVDVKVVNNLTDLKSKIRQGYALKDVEKTTDVIKGQEGYVITVTDTIDVDFGNDNMFESGGYTITEAGNDTIKMTINEILNQGGEIIGVDIESSTDAEMIRRFRTPNDPTGNIQLARLRYESIARLIDSFVNGVPVKHRELPNNGSNVVSTQDFINVSNDPRRLKILRDLTSEYRYTKLRIIAVFKTKDEVAPTPDKFIERYRAELVKVSEVVTSTKNINTRVKFMKKQYKCIKPSGKGGKMLDCTSF